MQSKTAQIIDTSPAALKTRARINPGNPNSDKRELPL